MVEPRFHHNNGVVNNSYDALRRPEVIGNCILQLIRYSTIFGKIYLDTRGDLPNIRKAKLVDAIESLILSDLFDPALKRAVLPVIAFENMYNIGNARAPLSVSNIQRVAANFWTGDYPNLNQVVGVSYRQYQDVMLGLYLTYNNGGDPYFLGGSSNNDYGLYDAYITQNKHLITGVVNPLSLGVRMRACLLIDGAQARKFRTNILMERDVFEFDHNDFRLWVDKSVDLHESSVPGSIVEQICLNAETSLQLIVEDKPDLLAQLVDIIPPLTQRQVATAAANYVQTPSSRRSMIPII